MIFGVGTDIAKVRRFERWVRTPGMVERFFSQEERLPSAASDVSRLCQHYAARFAAKEAFAKALGTGLRFELRDVCVRKNGAGRPYLFLSGSALRLCRNVCGPEYSAHLSLSHEKEYAIAVVVVEIIEKL